MPEVFPKTYSEVSICADSFMQGLVVEPMPLEAHCSHKWKPEFLLAKHGCSSKQTGEVRTIMSLTCHGVESFMWLLMGSSVLRGAFDVSIQPFVWSWVCKFLFTTGRCFQTSLLGWSHRNGETAGVLPLRQRTGGNSLHAC